MYHVDYIIYGSTFGELFDGEKKMKEKTIGKLQIYRYSNLYFKIADIGNVSGKWITP